VVGAALALSIGAALTTPFTWPADLITAAAFALVVGAFVARARDARVVGNRAAPPPVGRSPAAGRRWPWVVWAAAALAWELSTYVASPRHAHPTVSSITDLVTVHPIGRGVLFGVYLALGWTLARS
jgi:hypothetical protein